VGNSSLRILGGFLLSGALAVGLAALATLLTDAALTAALLRRSGDTASLRWYSR